MRVDLLSPFPEMARSVIDSSILKRAREKGLVEIVLHDLRDWTDDRHRSVDDAPYGGGPGMVLKIEPVARALGDLRRTDTRVICPGPQGHVFQQADAARLACCSHLIFLCGHYEGIDQRVIDHLVDEEISVGDYVLTNGVLGSLVIIDAAVRLIPGVLGDDESARQDSFSQDSHLLDHPHYTRPAEFQSWPVPPVLLSGDHEAIRAWRAEEAARRTRLLRPDLWEKFTGLPDQSA
jgi:tRNA (guanine37-N1)-methyltransferase